MDSADPVDQLVDRMREDLARGEYHPRERLIESDLVERYGFPRGTVRNALLLLSADGLIERLPNRGASVRGLTIDEGIELAEVRRELEALCARDAAIKGTTDERAHVASILGALQYAAGSGDAHGYRRSSIDFHQTIIDMSRHEVAARQLVGIRLHNLQRQFPTVFQGESIQESEGDHVGIGQAILAGDSQGAERLMHAHIDRVVRLLAEHRGSRS